MVDSFLILFRRFAAGRLLVVAFVERDNATRIISARRAVKGEADATFTAPR